MRRLVSACRAGQLDRPAGLESGEIGICGQLRDTETPGNKTDDTHTQTEPTTTEAPEDSPKRPGELAAKDCQPLRARTFTRLFGRLESIRNLARKPTFNCRELKVCAIGKPASRPVSQSAGRSVGANSKTRSLYPGNPIGQHKAPTRPAGRQARISRAGLPTIRLVS